MREETERRKIRIDLIDIDGEPIPKRPNPTQMGYFNSKDRGASKSHFRISNPDIEIIEPTNSLKKRTDGLEVDYYKWNTFISANKIKTLTYKIRPTSLGEYTIGETVVSIEGLEYYGNTISFTVNCNPNGQCSEDENYLNCPQDCETGLSDGICDYKADSICDPDCTEDPDCEKTSNINIFSLIIYLIGGIIVIILGVLFLPKLYSSLLH